MSFQPTPPTMSPERNLQHKALYLTSLLRQLARLPVVLTRATLFQLTLPPLPRLQLTLATLSVLLLLHPATHPVLQKMITMPLLPQLANPHQLHMPPSPQLLCSCYKPYQNKHITTGCAKSYGFYSMLFSTKVVRSCPGFCKKVVEDSRDPTDAPMLPRQQKRHAKLGSLNTHS